MIIEFTILHTNDFHGRQRSFPVAPGNATSQTGDPGQPLVEFEREGLVGGFAAQAALIDRIRRARGADSVLLVNAGDSFSDDLLGNLTRGEAVVRLMDRLGYRFMALGNHDFDYGADRTRELQGLVSFPMRGANVIDRASGEPFLGNPALLLDVGGVRVGLLALGYHNTALTGNPDHFESLSFVSGIEAARRYVPGLREQADVVLIVSHQGTAGDELLAREGLPIDLIVGGHSHDWIGAARVGDTWIAQAAADAAILGETVLAVENGRVTDVSSRLHTLWIDEFPPDPQVAAMIEELRAPYADELEQVLARAVEPIGRNYRSESPFDKLVGQILLSYTGAEAAFLPGVGYGVTLQPGSVTREALYRLLPHPARVVTLELSGQQMLEVLEQSATNQRPEHPLDRVGGLVQTAGMRWTVEPRRPPGRRVSDVRVGGSPLDPQRSYRVATQSGMLAGIHRYTSFAQGRSIERMEMRLNELVEQAFLERRDLYAPELGDIVLQEKWS